MKALKAKKVIKKKSGVEVNSVVSTEVTSKAQSLVEERMEELSERIPLDMTGWEKDFDYEDMKDLFYIQVGQYSKKAPCVNVKLDRDITERWVGGYNPNDPSTPKQYVVLDRITFQPIYCGHSFEKALSTITRTIKTYKNDPERYFKDVCEFTNEDFYFRHYEGRLPFSDAQLKRRAEEGRTWRAGVPMKKIGYAIYKTYGYVYKEEIEEAEDRAIEELKEERERRREKKLQSKRKKIRLKSSVR